MQVNSWHKMVKTFSFFGIRAPSKSPPAGETFDFPFFHLFSLPFDSNVNDNSSPKMIYRIDLRDRKILRLA